MTSTSRLADNKSVKGIDDGSVGYRAMQALIACVAAWLLALPVVSFVQTAALNRYHLQTSTFLAWALQAPVPAMYNFRNHFTLQSQRWDRPALGQLTNGTLNHFPVRLWTFSEGRASLYEERARLELVVSSEYRGRKLTTRWHLIEPAKGAPRLVGEIVP
jgi:hypothetical protein